MYGEYNPKRIATYFEQLREAEGYSRQQAAEIAGIHSQFIYTIEREARESPGYPILTAYATHAYQLTPDELASLAGMWRLPRYGYRPAPPKVIDDLQDLMHQLNPEDLKTFVAMLELYIDHQQQIHGITIEPETESDTDTPAWFEQKLQSIRERRARQSR